MLLNIMLLNNLDLFHLHLDNNRTEYLKNSCSALAIVTMAVELQKGKIKHPPYNNSVQLVQNL